jgi:glycosyltransferase involved in cell wall biosynthesis
VSEALSVTVIIRTGAATERALLLQRAIASVVGQADVEPTCVVVVNGENANPRIVESLRDDRRVQCIIDLTADKSRATLIGRQAVRTEFFTFLDDDDEFLPGALAIRARYLRERPWIACVATNGEYLREGRTVPVICDSKRIAGDYAGSVLRQCNWLASCGGTFRTSAVGEEYFDNLPPHREWTLIAYRIATRLPVQYLDISTYRIYSTPASQSKALTYLHAVPRVSQLMLAWNAGGGRAGMILRNENRGYRAACSYHRIAGDLPKAWRFYSKAVRSPFGLSFFPYAALLILRIRRPVPELLGPLGSWLSRRHAMHERKKRKLPLWCLAILVVGILISERRRKPYSRSQ